MSSVYNALKLVFVPSDHFYNALHLKGSLLMGLSMQVFLKAPKC